MRKPIIFGNWKLNKNTAEAVELAKGLKENLADVTDVEIGVAPVFTVLSEVAKILKGSNIALSAQDLYWEDAGAFTGEVSAPMLKDVGCSHVIIGHSERRQYFGETDATVAKKIKAALAHGLTPIVCIGETLEEREAEKTFDVIKTQCKGGLGELTNDELKKIVIAYEPVWAIGTGKTATPAQAQDVHKFIRGLLASHGQDVADSVRIQYGGSMKADNVKELMAQPDIDGGLVGGASLKIDSFVELIKNAV